MLAVYSDASNAPSTLLGVTPVTDVSTAQGWQTIDLASTVTATAGQEEIWLDCSGCLKTIQESDRVGTPARASSPALWSGGMPTSFLVLLLSRRIAFNASQF